MTMSLEQQRAADAWERTSGCDKAFVSLAKSVPALIMNSGLMQTLAFLESKKDPQHKDLARAMRRWLAGQFRERFGGADEPDYQTFMNALFEAEPREFQAITAEAMAWLRWVRQIAPTRQVVEG